MKFMFYSPVHFEPWDWRTPDGTGIGGSETAVVELTRRLASRGHEVVSFAPLADGCPEVGPGGERWLPLDDAAAHADGPGVWVLSRYPPAADRLPPRDGRKVWLVCQDVDYPNPDHALTPERCRNLDAVLALCPTHADYLRGRYPHLKGKVLLSGNGVRVDLIRRLEAARDVPRDPYRIVWTGSPDRGLLRAVAIVRRAREFEPRLTLTACYGVNNIAKCTGPYWRSVERQVKALADEPWIDWTGRLNQPELYDVIRSAGLWVYCTGFQETGCICSMEAMCLGAVPVFSPLWAVNDNCGHGLAVPGDPDDPLTRARFASAVVRLTRDVGLQESIRAEMVPWAREKFSWERVADDYEGWADPPAGCRSWYAQYAFQLRHAKGRVLNVGCNCDMPGFGRRGGVNLDLLAVDPYTGCPNAAHALADAREPLPVPAGFDTVILGDILEHMNDADAVACLRNAAAVLAPGGRVLATVPEDHRGQACPVDYAPGVPGGHPRPVTRPVVAGWLAAAGLRAGLEQPIEYGEFTGVGIVAEVPA